MSVKSLKISKLFLALIILFFLITRLYKISEIPPSVYWDEASIGYNAYSILQTGKDEWGEAFPIHFRAFGEFKLPIYIYSIVPFVKLFGLNELSVRVPAVLFSLGTVILTYLLAKKIFKGEYIGLFSAFLVTISPWFFIFSRTGFEVTAGIAFYLLGIYLFLWKFSGRFFFLSILSFILSAYSYNSFRILVPITILILLAIERNSIIDFIKKSIFWVILSFITILLSIWPIARLYIYDTGISRFQIAGEKSLRVITRNYISHFSPIFLFTRGDNNLRHQQIGFSQLYIPELLLIIFGIIYIIKNKGRYGWLPIMLILISPIPAAITKDSPHALRSLSMMPFIHIISAGGFFFILHFFKKRFLICLLILSIYLISFGNYFINFITVYPIRAEDYWQINYKKIFTNPKLDLKNENKIYVSDQEGQPYIFALFYLKYNPERFREDVIRNTVDKWGYSTVKSFGSFEFGK